MGGNICWQYANSPAIQEEGWRWADKKETPQEARNSFRHQEDDTQARREEYYRPYYEFRRRLQIIGLQVSKCLVPTNKTRQKFSPCNIPLTWTTVICVCSWILANTPPITQQQPHLPPPPTCTNNAPVCHTRHSQITRKHQTTTIPTITIIITTNQPSI